MYTKAYKYEHDIIIQEDYHEFSYDTSTIIAKTNQKWEKQKCALVQFRGNASQQ